MNEKHYANYHSHTYLCGHAQGTILETIIQAKKTGLTILGISEHAPMENLRNVNSRLTKEAYQVYLKELNEGLDYAKGINIKFYKGLEVEYYKHLNVYDEFLNDLDYLVLGHHYIMDNNSYKSTFRLDNIDDIKQYVLEVVEALKTGYFNLLAHPDLCFHNIENPTDEMYELMESIIDTAILYDIPLELNANGIRKSKNKDNNLDYNKFKYPRIKFFEMVAKKKAKVIISSDSHNINDLNDWAVLEAYKFAEKLNLNLIYELNMDYRRKLKD